MTNMRCNLCNENWESLTEITWENPVKKTIETGKYCDECKNLIIHPLSMSENIICDTNEYTNKMTVEKLIKELSKYPGHLPITILDGEAVEDFNILQISMNSRDGECGSYATVEHERETNITTFIDNRVINIYILMR